MRRKKQRIAYVLSFALLLGILPPGTTPVSRAADESGTGCELNNPTIDSDGVTTWDCVYFGHYRQGDTDGDGIADRDDDKQPIKWRVLSVSEDGTDAFLLADQNLDERRYNETRTAVTWETCTMRSWLNGYSPEANVCGKDYTDDNFINEAFSADERAAIKETTVVNPDNPKYNIDGGNDTTDKVYLLSLDEVAQPLYGFAPNLENSAESRAAKTTLYAKMTGVETATKGKYDGCGSWWLRSPGFLKDSFLAAYVMTNGEVSQNGTNVNTLQKAIRPALHLDLSSSVWKPAGTVTSEEGENMDPESSPTVKPGTSGLRSPTVGSDGVTTWDCVYFGEYWQDDTNRDGTADKSDEKKPIKWRVLLVKGDDAFLLADQNLDCQTYNETRTDVTWETCTLRSWLNGYGADSNICGRDCTEDNFIDNAFTAEEQRAIKSTTVVNADNPSYNTAGGNDTTDKVYLLSLREILRIPAYGFTGESTDKSKTRRGENTPYAKTKGDWWLRSPGSGSTYASEVWDTGYVSKGGMYVDVSDYAVRPVLHLDLSSSVWEPAGTINSEGKVNVDPESSPSATPTVQPSAIPTVQPSATPTVKPAVTPTVKPSATPTIPPSASPTVKPSAAPTITPSTFVSDLKNPTVDQTGVITTWDCVYFGHYWQSDTNGDGKADRNDAKEPIKWRVLSVNGDDAFLLADQNLDCKLYNNNQYFIKWEECTLRSWLNGYDADSNKCQEDYTEDNFIDNAFTIDEQAAIKDTTVVNADNREYYTEGGKNTIDKVYLLSFDEVQKLSYGFISSVAKTKRRESKNSAYAEAQGAYTPNYSYSDGTGNWWLRSPGCTRNEVCGVDDGGGVYQYAKVTFASHAVRPVLHLKLSSESVWSYAGTVASEIRNLPSTALPVQPSATPTVQPSTIPTVQPSATPTAQPGESPTVQPTAMPTVQPSASPDIQPGASPTVQPGGTLTVQPGGVSTVQPSVSLADEADEADGESEIPEQKLTKVTGLKGKVKKKAIQVSWKKAAGANGYELWYSTTKKWNKKKTKTTKKTKLTLGKLKSKKTYYIRVRAYTIQNGKKVYGRWSKTVKKKVK